MNDDFASLALAPALLANLASLAYHRMTPIQAAVLPLVLEGRDVIAEAKTGSGKTVAFGLGVIAAVDPRRPFPQALVLCPTRELAEQVASQLRKLARATPNLKVLALCGGVPLYPQIASLRHGAHVVVGTPGRVGKHARNHRLDLSRLDVVVLDEGDRMLDMGFAPDILAILAHAPAARQTLLFSATYPREIADISAAVQREPVRISVDNAHAAEHIVQRFHEVEPASVCPAVRHLLLHYRPQSALLFCNTKQRCAELATELRATGITAMALHGDLEQVDRERVLALFSNGSVTVLVATDVAARGLDIDRLDAVMNVELPWDPEVYLHRIGRTGRAGAGGLALALFGAAELPRVRAIEAFQGTVAAIAPLPAAPQTSALPLAPRVTLCIAAGRRDKLRPGDVLGALTNEGGVVGGQVGKIHVGDRVTYVAIDREVAAAALAHLQGTPIKGRRLRVTRVAAE